ncbi:MAG: FlgD immunoglobulin-like domain containing protein [Candidatus Krumholzibacteriia bacterium]
MDLTARSRRTRPGSWTRVALSALLLVIAVSGRAFEVTSATGLRAEIHTPADIADGLLRRDGDRLWLQHPQTGDVELMTAAPGGRDLVTPSADVVAAALASVQGFRSDLRVHVFILPAFPAGVESSFARRDAIYLAPAFGPQADEVVAYTVTHELGHVLCWAAIDGHPDRWDTYRALRGLDVQDDPESLPHAERNREIVAEDFRALFGGPLATASGTLENGRLAHPDAVPGLRDQLGDWLATAAASGPDRAVSSVYPNPCRQEARIELRLGDAADKTAQAAPRLEIFDVRGRLVRRVQGGTVSNGRATVTWDARGGDGRRVPGGLYLYRVSAAGTVSTGRLLLLEP